MSEAVEILKLVSGPDFQRKLNDYVRAKQDAEDAAEKAEAAREANEASMRELEEKLIAGKAELAKAKEEHDAAADEAAKRIALAVAVETRIKKALEILRSVI